MTDPGRGRLRRTLAALAGLCCAAASLAGSSLAGSPGAGPPRDRPLTLLQMNLCNSGAAGCYTGRGVARAAEIIRDQTPDVVSLNEICEKDVRELAAVLTGAHRAGTVISDFQAAFSLRTGAAVRCNNGQLFGVGLLVHVAAKEPEHSRVGGLYPMQTRGEQRAWLCLHVSGFMQACTTHLALGTNGVSLAQCRYLVSTATVGIEDEPLPKVVAGDFNLGAADATPCLPPEFSRADDGGVQQVMASAELVITSSRLFSMSLNQPNLNGLFPGSVSVSNSTFLLD